MQFMRRTQETNKKIPWLQWSKSRKIPTNLQCRYIGNGKSISSIIRLRDLGKAENQCDCLLHLRFFCASIPRDCLFNLKWSKFPNRYSSRGNTLDNYSSCLGYINPIGDITQEKQSLDSNDRRFIGIEDFSNISMKKEEFLTQDKPCRGCYDPVINHPKFFSFFFYQSKTRRSCTGINTKYYHEGSIGEKGEKSRLYPKNLRKNPVFSHTDFTDLSSLLITHLSGMSFIGKKSTLYQERKEIIKLFWEYPADSLWVFFLDVWNKWLFILWERNSIPILINEMKEPPERKCIFFHDDVFPISILRSIHHHSFPLSPLGYSPRSNKFFFNPWIQYFLIRQHERNTIHKGIFLQRIPEYLSIHHPLESMFGHIGKISRKHGIQIGSNILNHRFFEDIVKMIAGHGAKILLAKMEERSVYFSLHPVFHWSKLLPQKSILTHELVSLLIRMFRRSILHIHGYCIIFLRKKKAFSEDIPVISPIHDRGLRNEIDTEPMLHPAKDTPEKISLKKPPMFNTLTEKHPVKTEKKHTPEFGVCFFEKLLWKITMAWRTLLYHMLPQ